MESWRNSTPNFGAAAFCTIKIDYFRASLTSTSMTTSSLRSSKSRVKKWNQIRLNKIKTTFDGTWPLMEDALCLKTTFDGRWPLMEDDLWWKTTFKRRRPLTEDDLCRKTTIDLRQPLTEDDLQRKMTFGGRRPLTEDGHWHTLRTIFRCAAFLGSMLPQYMALCVRLFVTFRFVSSKECMSNTTKLLLLDSLRG